VPDGDYAGLLTRLRPEGAGPGRIVALDGTELGEHDGIHRYTVGQRKGLGIGGLTEPLYVVALRPDRREVVVGPKQALARDAVTLKEVNWLGDPPGPEGLVCSVRLRSAMEPVPARAHALPGGGMLLALDEAHHGVSPGQAGVVYEGERVRGGGWISSAALTRPVSGAAA
jgi:tRNA-specific 2-thiouridylase